MDKGNGVKYQTLYTEISLLSKHYLPRKTLDNSSALPKMCLYISYFLL